jgi:hypothetical protein
MVPPTEVLQGLGRLKFLSLLPTGPRPLWARLPDTAGPAAEGAGARGHRRHRRCQPLPRRALPRETGRSASPSRKSSRAAPSSRSTTPSCEILCIEELRRLGNDNTVVFHRHRLQIPPGPLRPHFVKAQVKVRRYLDGTFAVFHGPRQISRYSATGELQDETSSPGVNRFDAEPACGFDGRHPRVAHNLKWTPIAGPLA